MKKFGFNFGSNKPVTTPKPSVPLSPASNPGSQADRNAAQNTSFQNIHPAVDQRAGNPGNPPHVSSSFGMGKRTPDSVQTSSSSKRVASSSTTTSSAAAPVIQLQSQGNDSMTKPIAVPHRQTSSKRPQTGSSQSSSLNNQPPRKKVVHERDAESVQMHAPQQQNQQHLEPSNRRDQPGREIDPIEGFAQTIRHLFAMQSEGMEALNHRTAYMEGIVKARDHAQNELVKARSEMQAAQSTSSELAQRLDLQQKFILICDERLEALTQSRACLTSVLVLSRSKQENVTEKLNAMDALSRQWEKDMQEHKELKSLVQTHEQSISRLTNEKQRLESELAHATEFNTLFAEMNVFRDDLAKKTDGISGEITTVTDLLNQTHQSLETTVKETSDQNKELSILVTDLKSQLLAAENKIADLVKQVEQLNLEIKEKDATNARLSDRFDQDKESLKQEHLECLESAQTDCKTAQVELGNALKDNEQLKTEVLQLTALQTNLEKELEDSKVAFQKLLDEKASLSESKTSLTSQLSLLKQNFTSIEKQLLEEREKFKQVNQRLEESCSTVTELTTKLQVANQKVEQLELLQESGVNHFIQSKLSEFKAIVQEDHRMQTEELTKKNAETQLLLETKQSECGDLERKVSALESDTSRIDSLNHINKELEEKLKVCDQRLEDCETRRKAELDALAATMREESFKAIGKKEQEWSNKSYESSKTIGGLLDEKNALAKKVEELLAELAVAQQRPMARTLSDIENSRDADQDHHHSDRKPISVIKSESQNRQSSSSGGRNRSSRISKKTDKAPQRKITDKLPPSNSLELFQPPF